MREAYEAQLKQAQRWRTELATEEAALKRLDVASVARIARSQVASVVARSAVALGRESRPHGKDLYLYLYLHLHLYLYLLAYHLTSSVTQSSVSDLNERLRVRSDSTSFVLLELLDMTHVITPEFTAIVKHRARYAKSSKRRTFSRIVKVHCSSPNCHAC